MSPEIIMTLLDTSVLWDYLKYTSDHDAFRNQSNIKQEKITDTVCFEKLLNLSSDKVTLKWFYNDSTDFKLKRKYCGLWKTVKERFMFEKVSIPLTKADGRHPADESALAGGNMGGSLSSLNTSEKERFDTEHLETAIEHGFNYWLTHDYKKIRQITNRTKQQTDDNLKQLNKLTIRPSELLHVIREKEGN